MRIGVEEFDPRKREKRKARKEGERIDKRHQKERVKSERRWSAPLFASIGNRKKRTKRELMRLFFLPG
jgi:hypothetical protein